MPIRFPVNLLLASMSASAGAAIAAASAGEAIDFVEDVQPILREHCFACHAGDVTKGGLNLAVGAQALAGGESGRVIEPGDAQGSLLVQLVTGTDPDRAMPPEGAPLGTGEIATLQAWIDQGAAWPEHADVLDPKLDRALRHWAFQPLHEPAVPEAVAGEGSGDSGWAITAIDRFIAQSHREHGLAPTPPVAAAGLARRLYFGLVGLPPAPEEVAAFVAAAERDQTEAVDALADRLLASRHYGERWARHWLDAVRYADSDGQEADRDRPEAWRFRDFVIRSFNEDTPFDAFVRWQIAGDELQPGNAEAVVATGFLTAGTHTVLKDTFLEEERLRNRYNELDDIVSTLGTSMLGLTVGCARCHDHKFDAVSAREYYQLLAAFHSGDRHRGKLPDGTQGLFFREESDQPKPTWLFRRADFYDREQEVTLGFPAILMRGVESSAHWIDGDGLAATGGAKSTLQRRALAAWITDVGHGGGALLARVIVNRVWHHHFGRGLVRTTGDFGVRGDKPSHPGLLEWLAADFVRNGWRIKRLHRQIVRSAVYRQDVQRDEAKLAQDPANALLWRRTPQRLEAEVLRDAMLAVSGTLNLEPGGPGFKPFIPAEAIVARNLQEGGYPANAADTAATRRRSVYMFHKRLVPYPLFQAFDRPDLMQNCLRREHTTVAPQALALLNDGFVRAQAEDFASRLLARADGNDAHLVENAFLLSLGRQPSPSERQASLQFLQAQQAQRGREQAAEPRHEAIADFCQSLFSLNEFLYVD